MAFGVHNAPVIIEGMVKKIIAEVLRKEWVQRLVKEHMELFCWCRPTPPSSYQTSRSPCTRHSPQIGSVKSINVYHWGCQQDVAMSMGAHVTMTFGWRHIVANWLPGLRLMCSEEMV